MKNKRILIIGSSRGIGLGTAKMLHNEKFTVFGASRTKINVPFEHLELDLNSKESIDLFIKRFSLLTKGIEGLILNAGISVNPKILIKDQNDIKLQTFNEFESILKVNLSSYYYLINKLSNFLENNSSIIAISSIGSVLSFPSNQDIK